MSCTVKCVSCNIVIDELLAYLRAKLSSADEETLVRICTATFSSEDIQKSHRLLFESVPSDVRKIIRKGKGKEDRLVYDMLHFLKVTEPDALPIFVARNLEKLPPITLDHLDVSKLLKDIAVLQADIKQIQSSYVTVEQLECVKKDCISYKTVSPPFSAAKVNMKRGAYRDSGPEGLSLFDESCVINDDNNRSCSNDYSLHYRSINKEQSEGRNRVPLDTKLASASKPLSERAPTDEANDDSHSQRSVIDLPQLTTDQLTGGGGVLSTTNETYAQASMKSNNEWSVVRKKKTRSKNRVEGKSGTVVVETGEMFRAAVRKFPVFITNVHQDTCQSDIEKYILKMTGETVQLEKIEIRRQCDYKAYKFFVPCNKLTLFLDEKIWPEGIIFRRFINFKLKRNVTSDEKGGPSK
ncbi:uncharacterized protein LOC132901906 [Amyelois transitella]|uniref:uncharacterized protein LOC132901906 n=1 Tax=Amyelois transitella TaxID=680683 RepID=UPI00298FF492|nr:uncharacterized protein LOC132901906 [Amyelois transitella]